MPRLDELVLSNRAFNCCERLGFTTLEEVHAFGENNLLRTKNFGRKTLKEMREHMVEHGMNMDAFNGPPEAPSVPKLDEVLALTERVSQTHAEMENARKAYERARSEHAAAVGRLSRAVTEIAARQGL
jgi:molecular chaperone GrpE (heat shock protein)